MPAPFDIVRAGMGFVVALVYSNLFEYAFHRWLMHRTHRYVFQPYEFHVRLHHRIFRGDERYHVQDPEHRRAILFRWWQGPVIVSLHTPILWGLQVACGWAALWPGLAALASYYVIYEYLHWCMHNPADRAIERTSVFRYLDRNHRLHHGRSRFNFNVVCPLADMVFRTYEPASSRTVDGRDPRVPYLPNVQMK